MAQRIMRGATATLTLTILDADGSPVDAAGTITVTVATASGSAVTGIGSVTHPSVGVYTASLPAQATINVLTATWTDSGNSITRTTTHEIVGGYAFSLNDVRQFDGAMSQTNYADSDVIAKRAEVETEAENICMRSFTPRYTRVTLDGTGTDTIVLPVNDVRTVRSVTVRRSSTQSTTFDADALAALRVIDDQYRNQVRRTDSGVFDEGTQNIVVELEYGLDEPDADMKTAMLTRLRHRLNATRTGIPDRASSFTVDHGGTYHLILPEEWKTGIPDVDAVYGRGSLRSRAGAGIPASRPMDTDAQFYSLYHGGRR